ncbi:MAG TPA: S46 family peptidase [Rhizomicrobium sp.]|nr:S46 family peptidase [Rhizomicrobium sp.]
MLAATHVRADEGMWTFDNFPMTTVNAKYETHVDQAWLDRVRGAAVRLSSGCSASLVMAQGLVLTNHHCVRDCAQSLSNPPVDYVKDGFISARRIIGGNSGSPAIDAQGRVVGAIFDGNINSLGGAFGFDDRVNRAVAVSTASITEALRKVYDANELVKELTAHN